MHSIADATICARRAAAAGLRAVGSDFGSGVSGVVTRMSKNLLAQVNRRQAVRPPARPDPPYRPFGSVFRVSAGGTIAGGAGGTPSAVRSSRRVVHRPGGVEGEAMRVDGGQIDGAQA